MIWDLTFSQALLVFALVLTPVYLALLMFSRKDAKQQQKPSRTPILFILVATPLLMGAVIAFLSHIPGFKESSMYSILVLSVTGLLFYSLKSSSGSGKMETFLLAAVILFHLALLYSPPSGVSIHERAAAMAKLTLEGYWDPSQFSPSSVYSPVPMDVGLLSVSSILTSFPTIDPLNSLILFFLVPTAAYDVLVYCLCRRVAHSRVAGILAILILASTPPANFMSHGPKWIASMLVLVSAIALIKASDGVSSVANIAVANASYVVAIFFHPSAAIGGFLPLSAVLIGHLGKKALKNRGWERFSKSGLLRATAALFVTVTFARAIYTAGYLEAMLPSLNTFLSVAFGYGAPSEAYITVYERSVSPINAWAWASPVAMAAALTLYSFFKRKALGSEFTLIMSFVGAEFIFLGYLSAAFRAGGFQGAMYPAFVFLFPAAAVLVERVLKSSKILVAILIATMALCAGIASTDPTFSPERYRKAGAGDVETRLEDYTTALFLTDRTPSDKRLLIPYEIASSFLYFEVVADAPSHLRYTVSADIERMEVDRVVESKELLLGVMYIWPRRWLTNVNSHLADVVVNVYFDDTRHAIFEK